MFQNAYCGTRTVARLLLVYIIAAAPLANADIEAGIDITSVSIAPLPITDSNNVKHTLTITMTLKGSASCGNERTYFKLAFSDEPLPQANNANQKPIILNNASKLTLKSITGNNAQSKYYGGILANTVNFNVGDWGAEQEWPKPYINGSEKQTTTQIDFEFPIKSSTLNNIADPGYTSMSFYIVGYFGNRSSCNYYDAIKVDLEVYNNTKVKISGLQNIDLSQDVLSGFTNACVYSNTTKAHLDFDGANSVSGEEFKLENNGSGSPPIHYTLNIERKLSTGIWFDGPVNILKEGDSSAGSNGYWKFINTQNCSLTGGSNMTFTIKADANDVAIADAGIYSDTMTVTVSPR